MKYIIDFDDFSNMKEQEIQKQIIDYLKIKKFVVFKYENGLRL